MFQTFYRQLRLSDLLNSRWTLLAALGLLIVMVVAILPRAAAGSPDPVAAAWEKARAAGFYQFDSNITQLTVPVASVINVGRSSRTEQFHLSGETDLRQERVEMQLWSSGGSVLQGEGSLAIKVEDGKSYVRRGASVWQAHDSVVDGLAPGGDFLAYLRAVREVKAHPPETRTGIVFTRYAFELDGPTFAAYLRDRMAEALRAKGELPVSVSLDTPHYYRAMTGDGELWVGEDGLPLRQILNLNFPEQNGEFVSAQIVVDFSRFGAGSLHSAATSGGVSAWVAAFGVRTQDFAAASVLLATFALVTGILYFRRTRVLQTALAIAVILSMVVGPLLDTLQIGAFYTSQAAKAASTTEQQAAVKTQRGLNAALGAAPFNPHANPLEHTKLDVQAVSNGFTDVQSPNLSIPQFPNFQLADNGVDSDGDGLSDFVEERVGTDPANADSDEDGLSDGLEVNGFQFAGKSWYLNPLELDSNNDGIPDGLEWSNDGNSQPDDTDGDGIPDVFDADTDGDGIPDRQDLSPFSKGAATYSDANPLKLTASNLTAGKPTLVDFQLRPTDANRLWYAFNVLDWPRDDAGQVQDVDDKTYADLVASQGRAALANESYGDMKLIPMLEIRITGALTNLPPQSDLTPYNISVNHLTADGSQKVIYVPLSVVTSVETGQRVAFSGRMKYLPTGSWPSPHDIRLAWVVQTLVDIPCDATNPQDVAAGCINGYIHNAPQVIQSYYDDWTLTGFNVSEQHGAKTALIYEDPAVDGNLDDDYALTALTHGLDNSFLAGRDADNNNQRDVDIEEIARRFDRTNNGGVSPDQRWGLDGALNVLRVERHDYASFDQATIYTAMTDTVQLLTTQFNGAWAANNALKPTIAFAYEQQSRSLSLDVTRTNGGYITQSGANLTVNMQPGGQPRAALNTMVGLKWTRYCRPNSGSSWSPCSGVDNWEELERRYGNLPLADDPPGAGVATGSNALMQIYDLALSRGVDNVVQTDNVLAVDSVNYKTDAQTRSDVESGLTFGGAAVKKLANLVIMDRYLSNSTLKAKLGEAVSAFVEGSTSRGLIRDLKGFRTNPQRATQVSVAASVTLAAVAVGANFLIEAAGSNTDARIALNTLIGAVQTYASLVDPLLTVARWYRSGGSIANLLSSSSEAIGVSRTANAIGAVIAISIVWGFFIYNVVSSGISTNSIEFGAALAQAIATTIYIIILTIISATVIGLILVGIVTVIDVILTLVCEFAGGSCFSIGGTLIKALADAFYSYGLFIDTSRGDLVQPGAPRTTLADPNKGFVTSNELSITVPITTHIVQKKPSDDVLRKFGYLLTESLRDTTFRYSLTQPNPQDAPHAGRGAMRNEWGNVQTVERRTQYTLYSADAYTTPVPVGGFNLQPGLNRAASFHLNMGYAIPAYDCWRIYTLSGSFPFYKKIPVCSERTINGKNSSQITSLRYDIFPGSLDGFLTLATKADGGRGLSWDIAFPSLKDADGDGLRSSVHGGLDPDDAKWDTDGDGLSDAFELEQRAAGVAYSPVQCDSDGDGLTDAQEAFFGANPANADTDNDGLLDSEEVWHQVYNTSTCQPTNNWAGGWKVTVNAATPFTVRVTSDPTIADSDGDGVSDLAERQQSGQLDSQNRPYHPGVVNTPPIAVYTETGSRYVAPGGNLIYTTTVVANQSMTPGVLDVVAPSQLGGANASYTLAFNPATFSGSQSVAQGSVFTVLPGLNSQVASLTSQVRTRLAPTDPATLSWDPVVLNSLAIQGQPTNRYMSVAHTGRNGQDNYLASSYNSTTLNGTVVAHSLPTGQVSQLFASTATDTLVGNFSDTACNNVGVCLVAWEQRNNGPFGVRDWIYGQIVGPNGQAVRSLQILGQTDMWAYRPTVASDGVDFLVVFEYSVEIFGHPSNPSVGIPTTRLFMARYNSAGDLLTTANEEIEFGRVAPRNQASVGMDLVWIGDRYRLAWKFIRPQGFSPAPMMYVANLDAGGNPQGSLANSVGGDVTNGAAGAPSLAYDPVNNRTLLLYRWANGDLYRVLFAGSSLTPVLNAGLIGRNESGAALTTGNRPLVAYNPMANGWLIGIGGGSVSRAMLWAPDLTDRLLPDRQESTVIHNGSIGGMACPAPLPQALIDLRFEETPGATTFIDSSGRGNHATCFNCPGAGGAGAIDSSGNAIGTPASDYAVTFNGDFAQGVLMQTPVQNTFTFAFWYRSPPSANPDAFWIDGGQGFFNFYVFGQSVRLQSSVSVLNAARNLNDGAWHFVVGTRNDATGQMAIYIDGVLEATLANANPPTPRTPLLLRSSRAASVDEFQYYPYALSASQIQAIYNRTAQAYCVVAQPNQFLPYWYKLNITRSDPRGGKITASGGMTITIDADKPTSTVGGLVNNQFIRGNTVHTIGGNATDATSGVAKVEMNINNTGWQPATGAETWAYNLAATTGNYTIQTRATDAVGNVETPAAGITVRADSAAPAVTLNAIPTAPSKPTLSGGLWATTLAGTVSDTESGVQTVEVLLQGQGDAIGNGWQTATRNGNNWSIGYLLPSAVIDPTGVYTASVRAVDNVGNQTPDNATTGILALDVTGPSVAVSALDAARTLITDTLMISGLITETGAAGIDKLEIAFIPIEKIAALPVDATPAQADAQLNRTWLPVNLAQRGAGIMQSAWSVQIPAGLENEYQIDLRAVDLLGNVVQATEVWRGVIDTLAPRLTVTGTRGAVSWVDPINGLDMFELVFTCTAIDRYLDDATFTCPSNGAMPVRTFARDPVLQALFPDRTIRNGLTVSATVWRSEPNTAITLGACDVYGRCATTSQPLLPADVQAAGNNMQFVVNHMRAASANGQVQSASAPGAPFAVVVAPTAGSIVATDGDLRVTVVAEAAAPLKDLTIRLDNNVMQTLSFAQSDQVTRILRTVTLSSINEGQHTLAAHATDWANAAQSVSYSIHFIVDRQAPTVTIDPSTLTNADTWAVGSGVLRFNGTASDNVGLAAVQIREGNSAFVDVAFGDGLWQTALPVTDPEGRTLTITVRAIDRAGRVSEATQTIGTNLSSSTAPDTAITAAPADPSAVNSTIFEFVSSANAAAFACQLDEGEFVGCVSPWAVSDLSKGAHTFRVRAIDAAGNVDLTPASYTWTVNASALDATITAAPANPSSRREAGFRFAGTGSGFECSLDGEPFTACATPKAYSGLSYGNHSFAVRAVNGGGQSGAAARYTWNILNTPPVAADQSLTTLEDEVLAVTLSASDEDPLTYQVVTPPTHGVLIGAAPNLSYLPDSGFSGADSFTFRAYDGQSQSNLAMVTIMVEAKDNTPPTSAITRNPAAPQGLNGWYTVPVRVTVTASDGDDPKASGVAETRCVLDPANPPAAFADLPAACAYLGTGAEVTADGLHTVYAASRDNRSITETPVSQSFQIDRTPPTVSVTGVSGGVTYPLGAVPTAACTTTDATAGVANAAAVQVSGGNAHGVGSFTATCGVAVDQAGNASVPVSASYTVGYALSRFVVLGQEGVALGLLSEVNSGDVGARAAGNGPFLADNAEVSIGQQAKMLDPNSRVLGNRLAVRLQARVYNPSYNSLINNGEVLGTSATPLTLALLPALPVLPTINPSGQNLSVAQFGVLAVDPGRYGNLTVNQYATVTFRGGVYHFQSWSVNQYAKLYFEAPTEIRVAGRVNVVQYSTLAPAPTAPTLRPQDIVLYVAGQNGNNGALSATPKAAVFGQGSTLKLNVVAPNGTIQVDQLANVTGALLGRWVSTGQQVKLTLASAVGQSIVVSSASLTGEETASVETAPESDGQDTSTPESPPGNDTSENAWASTYFLPLVSADHTGVFLTAAEELATPEEASEVPATPTQAEESTLAFEVLVTPTHVEEDAFPEILLVPLSDQNDAAASRWLYLPVVAAP